jgi:hypothetical protein
MKPALGLFALAFAVSASPAFALSTCKTPYRRAVFCTDTTGCFDSIMITSCGTTDYNQDERCESSTTVECCSSHGKDYRVGNCQVIAVDAGASRDESGQSLVAAPATAATQGRAMGPASRQGATASERVKAKATPGKDK